VTRRYCDHYWEYDQTVWAGHRVGRVLVGRYCYLCGKVEYAQAEKWRRIPDKYITLRKHLTAQAKAVIR